jgi:hypothetical protein
MIGHVVGVPPPAPTLHGLSQTLEGFPHRPLRPCFVPLPLLGLQPSRAFPSRPTLPGSSPGDTLSVFPPSAPKSFGLHPQGLVYGRGVRDRVGSVSSLIGSMLSWAFPLSRYSTSRGGSSLDGPSAHGLGFAGVHARPRRWPSTYLPRVARRLPLSQVPTVSAFLAFRSACRSNWPGFGPGRR